MNKKIGARPCYDCGRIIGSNKQCDCFLEKLEKIEALPIDNKERQRLLKALLKTKLPRGKK